MHRCHGDYARPLHYLTLALHKCNTLHATKQLSKLYRTNLILYLPKATYMKNVMVIVSAGFTHFSIIVLQCSLGTTAQKSLIYTKWLDHVNRFD